MFFFKYICYNLYDMTNNKKKNILIIILVVLCTFFLALANKSLSNGIPLDEVKISKEDKERFAIKVEDSNGDYIDYNGNTWPSIGYIFNEDKSGCTDSRGNKVLNVLFVNNVNIPTIRTKKTVHCYLYYDIDNSAYATILRSNDYTLYNSEANREAGTFYKYSGDESGKRNVIYADHCWQIYRTTKNNSMKMIYNGEPFYDSTLGRYICTDVDRVDITHIGLEPDDSFTFGGTYYFGTGYYYDENAGAYKLSGEVGPYDISSNYNLVKGMYTCGKTTANANCSVNDIRYIFGDGDKRSAFRLETTLFYKTAGKTDYGYLEADESGSISSVGYMFNYEYHMQKYIKRTSFDIRDDNLNYQNYSNYYFGDGIEPDGSLSNPVLGSSLTGYPQSLVGKYTKKSTNSSYKSSYSYYVMGITSDNPSYSYYVEFRDYTEKDSPANIYLFGTGYNVNGDGTITITGAFELSLGDWYQAYSNGDITSNSYLCKPETYTYNSVNHTGICNNVYKSNTFSNIGYDVSYSEVLKFGYTFEERTAQEQQDGMGRYKLVGNNNLTNSLHTTGEYYSNPSILNNSHYTCFNLTGICDDLNYFVYSNDSYDYYISLSPGETMNMILDNIINDINLNSKDSKAKALVDAWYMQNILNKMDSNNNLFSSYLDTKDIFCNNRSIYDYGGWSPAGDLSHDLKFYNPYYSCEDSNGVERVIDEFSVDSGNQDLTYPIALPSYLDYDSLPYGSYEYIQGFWFMEPYSLATYYNYDYKTYQNTMLYDGDPYQQGYDEYYDNDDYDDGGGIRPSLSLNHNVIFSAGDGTMEDPWIAALPN